MQQTILIRTAFLSLGFLIMHSSYAVESIVCKSTIIILNGPSAAGKSTLQKEIQRTFTDLYLTMGVDDFFDRPLPQEFDKHSQSIVNNELVRKGVKSVDDQGRPIFTLIVGPGGMRAVSGMHRAFGAFASAGNNLVIDYILYDLEWLPELVACLEDHRVYFVGITTPLEVVEAREKARGTSPVGHARSHYNTVHAHNEYDLELDTSNMSAQEAALKIKEFIQHNPEPHAFKKLQKKFGVQNNKGNV